MTPITIIIPAAGNSPGIKNYSARGKYFLLETASGLFTVKTDAGQTFNFQNPGDGFGDANSPTFKQLYFSNLGGAPVTLSFYASPNAIRSATTAVTTAVTATATLTNTLVNCAPEPENQIQVNTGGGGAALAFAAAGTYFRRATIIAQNTLDRNPNTGNVFIGIGNAHQPIPLAPGGIWTIEADTGGKRDLGAWSVSAATGGDGISIIYV
jgi:hypothetical protein